ncbi:MAG TPA: hypothetical protein VHB46_03150 [Burkholderiales bacterium]|nr:hypothetical protein [Burkholderiales bacterium]
MPRTLTRFLILSFLLASGAALAQNANEEAVQRVAQSHDPAMFLATGALYVKQEAVRANGGKALPPELDAEVERLIDAEVRDPAWFRETLAKVIAESFSAEEADTIATHFETPGGKLQRRTVELAVSEVLANIYTFTNKIDYQLAAASKREMDDLHKAAGPMRGTCNCPTPKEREEMQRVSNGAPLEGPADLSKYPEAVKFANSALGIKYMKTLTLQGISAMNSHFETAAKHARDLVAAGR